MFDYWIGGYTTIKVEAPDRDAALEAVSLYAIEDFENAGPLRQSDVNVQETFDDHGFDAAISTEDGTAWDYMKDDPGGRFYDEEDDDGPADHAGV